MTRKKIFGVEYLSSSNELLGVSSSYEFDVTINSIDEGTLRAILPPRKLVVELGPEQMPEIMKLPPKSLFEFSASLDGGEVEKIETFRIWRRNPKRGRLHLREITEGTK